MNQYSQRFLKGHLGVRRMKIIQINDLTLEILQALLAGGAQPFRMGINDPFAARTPQPSFGSDQYIIASPDEGQGGMDKALVMAQFRIIKAVNVGGVDKVATAFHKRSDDLDGFLFRWPSGNGKGHGA
jgi:hypothetical protein